MTHVKGADRSDYSGNIRQLMPEKFWRLSKPSKKTSSRNILHLSKFLGTCFKAMKSEVEAEKNSNKRAQT